MQGLYKRRSQNKPLHIGHSKQHLDLYSNPISQTNYRNREINLRIYIQIYITVHFISLEISALESYTEIVNLCSRILCCCEYLDSNKTKQSSYLKYIRHAIKLPRRPCLTRKFFETETEYSGTKLRLKYVLWFSLFLALFINVEFPISIVSTCKVAKKGGFSRLLDFGLYMLKTERSVKFKQVRTNPLHKMKGSYKS